MSGGGTLQEIQWFPKIHDQFITWGSEIQLYQVKTVDEIDHQVSTNIHLDLSLGLSASLLASETRYQYIRCVALSHRCSSELLLAAGLANGKVALCNFVPSNENNIEYTPKQSRPCVCLAWHEQETNLLAIGHDRNRSDNCITIWDTERGIPSDKAILHQIGLSETAHSLHWNKYGRVVYAGMSHKYIKIMDLRLGNPAVAAANTRAVYGLTISPNDRLLASYVDNMVNLWDIRNFEKPISFQQVEKNISDISWCTSRTSTLGMLQRDSPYIHIFDFHCSSASNEPNVSDIETHAVKRLVAPFYKKSSASPRNVCSISWHPTDGERLLALSSSGIISDYRLQQRIAICFDPLNNLCGSTGVQLSCLNPPSPPSTPCDLLGPWDNIATGETNAYATTTDQNITSSLLTEDIADIMHSRTINDYGKLSDIQKNGELANNPTLKSVWNMLAHMTREECVLGLKQIVGISETFTIAWHDFPNAPHLKAYKSEQREYGQHICGWSFDRNNKESFMHFIESLCSKQEYTRAALIACFQLKIRVAIDILSKGADHSSDASNLRMAAIALSGFSFEKGAIWRSQSMAQMQISDPHLRTIFTFLLVAESANYEKILNERSISLSDRMAFACLYLSETRLADYIKTMISNCTKAGDLKGLLLTGATQDGINLLQSYLDLTEDVQTVALIAIKFLPKDLIQSYHVQYWIQSYRELLDIWRLWEHRAHLDVSLGYICSPPRHSRSVFLSCSFCGKNVSACLQEETRARPSSSNINKLSSCPSCRKPLPRCSLCLLHMGTTNGFLFQNKTGHVSSGWQSKPFSKWYSWCQSCRHGGHTEHLTQWFGTHAECPVASCSCKCFGLDFPLLPLSGTTENTY